MEKTTGEFGIIDIRSVIEGRNFIKVRNKIK